MTEPVKSQSELSKIMSQVESQRGSLGGRIVRAIKDNPIKSAIAVLTVVGIVIAAVLKGAVMIAFFATPWGWVVAAAIVVVALVVLFAWKISKEHMHKELVGNIVQQLEQKYNNSTLVDYKQANREYINVDSSFREYYAEKALEHMKGWLEHWNTNKNEKDLWEKIKDDFVTAHQQYRVSGANNSDW